MNLFLPNLAIDKSYIINKANILKKWQATPVFLPGESHGQRSLAGYSPWDSKGTDMTERPTHLTFDLWKHKTKRIKHKNPQLLFSKLLSLSKGKKESEVTKSCPTLCYPMLCSRQGSSIDGIVSRQEYWSGLPFPSPGDLPDPGIKPGSPALYADTLPSEPPTRSTYFNSA